MAETARAQQRFDTDPQPSSDPGVELRTDPGSRPIPLSRKKIRRASDDARAPSAGRVVIVGNGMVSRRLCEHLLQQGAGRELPELVVFGEESRPAYDRIHLGEILGGRSPESLLLAPPSWYMAHGIRLHLGDPVELVDPVGQTVLSRRGHQLHYDKLVLATGASPISPPVIADPQDLLFLRTVEDALQLQRWRTRARTAAVIGGGLLGVETAAALREAGLEVAIVEIGDHLMRRQLDADTSSVLRRTLEQRGVTVFTGRALSTISRDGDSKRLILSEGVELRADIVVVATGVRPRDELGGPELARHPQGGYLVDEYLRTSDPRIFAIGDCAVVGGAPAGRVLPGYRMAEAVAVTLLGEPRRFVAPAPAIRLKLPGTPLLLVGQCPPGGWTATKADKDSHRALAVQDGKLVAAAALGAWPEWNRLEQAVVTGEPLTSKQVRRFSRGGDVWARSGGPAVNGSSADAILCTCNLVRQCTVQAAIGSGCRTVSDVILKTRACGGCGSCTPVVEAMLAGTETEPVARPIRTLATAGVISLGATLALLATVSPAVRRLAVPERWDFFWREPLYQQMSGFALVGLFLLALLLPLRNKLGARMPGSGNTWRAIHGLVGVLLVLGLVVHSSARLGQGLNLGLSAATAGLVLVGAGAALGWRRVPPQRKAVRALLRPLHRALLWPALGLAVAHVLAVYYF